MSLTEYPIHVNQLQPGVYIRIDAKGVKSPFFRDSFKIKTQAEIDKIKGMGLTHVVCVLSKSDSLPIPPEDAGLVERKQPAAAKAAPAPKTPVSREILGLKSETIEKNKERRARFAKCERQYEETMGKVVALLRRVTGRSDEAMAEAAKVVDAMVATFVSERDVMVNLMSSKPQDEQKNYHALNVTVLSLMLGRELKLGPKPMHLLGMGALFHDLGKGRVPMEMVHGKATSMNTAFKQHYLHHPEQGARLARDMPSFPKKALDILAQHHERQDGSGFPARLKGDAIFVLARIVAITDRYDKLINPENVGAPTPEPLTPHLALKRMYAEDKGKLDHQMLPVFIRTMGVYPPGTVVKLSNGVYGMVVNVNPKKATRPGVLIHHPEIPKKEALMVDLGIEEELDIAATVRPEDLPREVFAYLSPSKSINYYADAAPGA